jgi:isocitrate lyase
MRRLLEAVKYLRKRFPGRIVEYWGSFSCLCVVTLGLSFLLSLPLEQVYHHLRRVRSSDCVECERGKLQQEIARVKAEIREMEQRGRFLRRSMNDIERYAEAVAMARIRGEYGDKLRESYGVQRMMAWNFYEALRSEQRKDSSVNTMGAFAETDGLAMAGLGFKWIYIGGWQESMRIGRPDLARYQYTQLTGIVRRQTNLLIQHESHRQAEISLKLQQLNQAQQAGDQKRIDQLRYEIEVLSKVNFLLGMVVDGDTGHMAIKEMTEALVLGKEKLEDPGGVTHVAAIHFEDQAHGCKKCGHLAGKVLVDTETHINRLKQSRFQLDVMGIPTVAIARTDAEAAEYITGILDSRDQPFLLGATVEVEPLAQVMRDAWSQNLPGEQVEAKQKEWKTKAKVMTLGEAIAQRIEQAEKEGKNRGMSARTWREFVRLTAQRMIEEEGKGPVDFFTILKSEARKLKIVVGADAQGRQQIEGIDVLNLGEWQKLKERGVLGMNAILWDTNLTITPGDEGYTFYLIQSGIEMAIARSKAFLPYADIHWMEQHEPDPVQAEIYAQALKAEARRLGISLPPLLAINMSPSFKWLKMGEKRLREKIGDTAFEQLSPEEKKRRVLEETIAFSQELSGRLDKAGYVFQFNTYGLSQVLFEAARAFAQEVKTVGVAVAYARFQAQALEALSRYVKDSQKFAGVLWATFVDAAGLGHAVFASPIGERSTMIQFGGGR